MLFRSKIAFEYGNDTRVGIIGTKVTAVSYTHLDVYKRQRLDWDYVQGANGYRVYRATSENGTFTELTKSAQTGNGFTNSSAVSYTHLDVYTRQK